MRKRGLTSFEELLLNSRTCLLWPDCYCRENLMKWQEALEDEDQTFTSEELEYASDIIFYTCACVAHRCPDPTIKAYGERQYARLTVRRLRIAQQQREARAR